MLYPTRKIGESVIINDNIEVTVIDIRGKSIQLGFTFPTDATVFRRGPCERLQAANPAGPAGRGMPGRGRDRPTCVAGRPGGRPKCSEAMAAPRR